MAAPMIEINNVSMRFNKAEERVDSVKEWFIRKMQGRLKINEFYALRDITLSVEKGEVYGLVGLNGSGKSTLLKIIAGVMKPTSGECTVRGNVAPLIELGAGFDPDLTGQENVYLNGTLLGMSPDYLDEKYDSIVDFAELHDFMNVAIKNYSSGMVARLAFAVATIMEPDILICDEVLSVGDFLFQKKCEVRMNELMSGGTTVLLVSHDISLIESMCSKAAWLSKGRVVAQGDVDGVCNDYKKNALQQHTAPQGESCGQPAEGGS